MHLLECVWLPLHVHLGGGVTHVGDYHYWALLTLSRDHYFRYSECSGRRRSLEAALRRKPTCGFDYLFVKHV